MGCSNYIINGLKFDECESNLAGVKNVWLSDADPIEVTTALTPYSSVTVTAFANTATTKFYHYGMDEQVAYLTSTASMGDNGRLRYYTNEIRIAFPRMSQEKHAEFQALTHNKVKAIVEDNNGVFHFVSLDQYLRSNDGAYAQSGQNFDDENGYEVILSGRSAFPSIIIEKSVADTVTEDAATIGA